LDNKLEQHSDLKSTYKFSENFINYRLPYPKGILGWLKYKKRFLEVKDLLEEINPSIVILYGCPTISLFAKLLKKFCKSHKIYFVMDIVDWLVIPKFNIVFRIVKRLDVNYLKRYIANDADGIISISSYLKRYYIKKVNNVIIIPPISEYNCFKKPKINENNNIKKLIYIGNPFPYIQKNLNSKYFKDRLDLAIDYLSNLFDIEFVFNVYGITLAQYLFVVPKQKEKLERLNHKIIFHGEINNLEAKNNVSQADFSILFRNSNKMTNSGFPTKVSESISCGTPVITNSTSDLESYIINGKNGFLVNLDSKSLTNQLKDILSSTSSEINNMKLYCYNSNLFSYTNYIKDTRDFFNNIKTR
jgi:glycosyltransferase involved in cell wall biosynthesis